MRKTNLKSKKGKSSDNESVVDDANENGEEDTIASRGSISGDEEDKPELKKKRARKSGPVQGKEDDAFVKEDKSNGNSTVAEKKQVSTKKGSSLLSKRGKASKETDVKEIPQDEEYEVDCIIDSRQHRGKQQFKIRWKGYGPDNDTWEFEDSLNCPEIIKVYFQTHNEKKRSKPTPASKKKVEAKKKKKTEYSDDDTEEKEYEVDKILDVHFKKSGKREFLIHWKGFQNKHNTWEPEENLSCEDLIEKFMLKVDSAKSSTPRELRTDRQHTDRFTLDMNQRGRRLSRRKQGTQRATYHSCM